MRAKALLTLVVFLSLVGTSQAATLRIHSTGELRPQPYQSWLDGIKVKTPNILIDFELRPCPTPGHEDMWGCTVIQGESRVIYIDVNSADPEDQANTLIHEVAHVFDDLYLNDSDRQAFKAIFNNSRLWNSMPVEHFAVAYNIAARYNLREYKTWCPPARRVRIRGTRRYKRVARPCKLTWEYGYRATPSQHQKVIDLINQVAIRHGL